MSNRQMGKARLSRRPVQAIHCSGVRGEELRLENMTHKIANFFIVHDFEILVQCNEAAVIACLACRLKENECLLDVELACT